MIRKPGIYLIDRDYVCCVCADSYEEDRRESQEWPADKQEQAEIIGGPWKASEVWTDRAEATLACAWCDTAFPCDLPKDCPKCSGQSDFGECLECDIRLNLDLLAEAKAVIGHFQHPDFKDLFECDHSVGICSCETRTIINRLVSAIRAAEAKKPT